jgi:hypothetical protein
MFEISQKPFIEKISMSYCNEPIEVLQEGVEYLKNLTPNLKELGLVEGRGVVFAHVSIPLYPTFNIHYSPKTRFKPHVKFIASKMKSTNSELRQYSNISDCMLNSSCLSTLKTTLR